MAGKKKDPTPLVYYMAHRLEELRKQGAKGNDFGLPLGIKHPLLVQLPTLSRGIGPDVEQAIADKLTGSNVHELRQIAKQWRDAHPDWLPDAKKERDAAMGVAPPRSKWPWWPSVAKKATKDSPHLGWAIWAAGKEPRGHEPRPDKRTVQYVIACANELLDILPEEEAQRLHHEYRLLHGEAQHAPVPSNRPSGAHRAARRV